MNSSGIGQGNSKSATVVNTTIAELLFVLIFVMLAYTHYADSEHLSQTGSVESENAALRREIEQLKIKMGAIERELREVKVQRDDYKAKYEYVLEKIPNLNPGEARRSIEILQERDRKQKKDIVRMEEKIERLTKENAELRSKLASEGHKGVGEPACSLKPTDLTEFLLDVTLLEDGFEIKPAWDKNSDVEVRAIPGVEMLLKDSTITENEFRRAGFLIYEWTRKHPVKCRFFVRMYNKVKTLEKYILHRQLVEGTFYIKIMN